MDPAEVDATLAAMTVEEIADGLWVIDVFESWNMTPDEADEWRRRIVARWFPGSLGRLLGPFSRYK